MSVVSNPTPKPVSEPCPELEPESENEGELADKDVISNSKKRKLENTEPEYFKTLTLKEFTPIVNIPSIILSIHQYSIPTLSINKILNCDILTRCVIYNSIVSANPSIISPILKNTHLHTQVETILNTMKSNNFSKENCSKENMLLFEDYLIMSLSNRRKFNSHYLYLSPNLFSNSPLTDKDYDMLNFIDLVRSRFIIESQK